MSLTPSWFLGGDEPHLAFPPITGYLQFHVEGEAAPAGSKTAGVSKTGRVYVRDASKGASPWKDRVAKAAGEAMGGAVLFDGALVVRVVFERPRSTTAYLKRGRDGDMRSSSWRRWPTQQPDTLKLMRAVEDAMTGVVYRDDAQIVEQLVQKVYGDRSRCYIEVWNFPNERDA